ncbi:phosphate transport system permease protein [Clostridia bacterium]|nr:phosphate transport system permease protein [Clostridia bacterium]
MKIRVMLEKVMNVILCLSGVTAIAAVFVISLYMLINGVPAIQKVGLVPFLFGQTWRSTGSNPEYGILPFLLTSVYGTFGACLVGVPIGLMTSVFLAKIANSKIAGVVTGAVELLAGIPSVVYGLIGMLVLVPNIRTIFHLKTGTTLFSAIIVLTIMILPSIINVSVTALKAVPKEYEEASYALGATKIETIFKVSIPAAKSGIAAGIVLGIGRAVGEAMAVMMVAGNVANMPSFFKSVTFLTTAIAKEMAYAPNGSLQKQALYSIALVLFIFIMVINMVLNILLKGRKEK